MTRSTLPATELPNDELSDEDVAVLMPLLAQIQRARADQREALVLLAQQPDRETQ